MAAADCMPPRPTLKTVWYVDLRYRLWWFRSNDSLVYSRHCLSLLSIVATQGYCATIVERLILTEWYSWAESTGRPGGRVSGHSCMLSPDNSWRSVECCPCPAPTQYCNCRTDMLIRSFFIMVNYHLTIRLWTIKHLNYWSWQLATQTIRRHIRPCAFHF